MKPGSDEIRNIKMAETNNNYQKANRRKQLIKIQDTENEINAHSSGMHTHDKHD